MSIDTGDSVKKGSRKLLQKFQTLYDDVWVSDTCHEWLIIGTLKTNTWIFTHITTGRIVMMEGGTGSCSHLSTPKNMNIAGL